MSVGYIVWGEALPPENLVGSVCHRNYPVLNYFILKLAMQKSQFYFHNDHKIYSLLYSNGASWQ